MLKQENIKNDVTETKKLRQEVIVKLNDGSIFLGRIFQSLIIFNFSVNLLY